MAIAINRVRCYGGPLHGESLPVQGARFSVLDRRLMSHPSEFLTPAPNFVIEFDRGKEVTYTVERFAERRGNMVRQITAAIIDGKSNLLPIEQRELEHDIQGVPWETYRMPSFLHDYDRWFNATAYKHTGDESYVHEEFYLPPPADDSIAVCS